MLKFLTSCEKKKKTTETETETEQASDILVNTNNPWGIAGVRSPRIGGIFIGYSIGDGQFPLRLSEN
jgi:hypothetical protein